MQVTVDAGAGLERRVTVQIPEDTVLSEVDKRLGSLAGTVRIPGFRPGKAPVKVVAQRFGPQVRDEVVSELVQSTFVEAMSKESLRPAGTPTIDPLTAEKGKGIEYTAVFDVFPEIELPDPATLNIERPVAEVVDADVEKMLETLRKQRITWETAERAAQSGDRVVVDFEGSIDGEAMEQGRGTEVPVEIGSGGMIPGFEDGLLGIAADEERNVEATFPEDYHAAEVAGKTAAFKIKAHRVEASKLPELDEDFAAGFGVTEGGLEGLKTEIRGNMKRELGDTLRIRTKERVMDGLLQARSVEAPRSLVEQEIDQAVGQREMEIRRAGLDPSTMPADRDEMEPAARRRIALGLLLAELVRQNAIEADAARVRQRVEAMAAAYEDPQQLINWYYGAPERLSQVESSVLEDQIVDWVLERASVTEQPSSFDDLMNPGQTS